MAQDRKPPRLSEAQLEIMNIVWDMGEAIVADVWNKLSARRPIARNTVQTTMTRLEEKGWLSHKTDGKTFRYSAAFTRASALRRAVSRLADTAFGGSTEDLVIALLDGRTISKNEAGRIRAIIKKAEEKKR